MIRDIALDTRTTTSSGEVFQAEIADALLWDFLRDKNKRRTVKKSVRMQRLLSRHEAWNAKTTGQILPPVSPTHTVAVRAPTELIGGIARGE